MSESDLYTLLIHKLAILYKLFGFFIMYILLLALVKYVSKRVGRERRGVGLECICLQ